MLKVTRRDFLKIGVAGASLATAGRALQGFVGAEEPDTGSVSRTTGRPRQSVPTTCLQCPAGCGILGFVEDGRLVKIEGNPQHPNNHGKICAKGQAGLNQVYDPQRILYPLRRAGLRGEGKWERISWEEAYDAVANRLKALRERGHPEEFAFFSGVDDTLGLVNRFLDAYGTPTVLMRRALGEVNKRVAQEITWGADVEINDIGHSRYILNFGANPYEAHIFHLPLVQRLVEARLQNGAKLVTFDPRLSHTAGKSDEWLSIQPGTDSLIALAMANVIIKEGLYDRGFLDRWVNFPVDGLARHLSQFSLEEAERISGIRAADIRRIAREFAAAKPVTILSGLGIWGHSNGTQSERALMLLAAITGNIDVPGGYCLPRRYELSPVEPKPSKVTQRSALAQPSDLPLALYGIVHPVMPMIREGRQRISVAMIYMHNPAYSDPDHELAQEVLKDERLIPYLIAIDPYMSETAALADIILPDATYLERWYVDSGPSLDMLPYLSLRQPVIKPRGESVAFTDMLIELARRIGGDMERYFRFGSTEGYIRSAIAGISGLMKAGGMDYLKAHGFWVDPLAKPQYQVYEKEGFQTPSGKLEVFSRKLEEAGFSALPTYEPPTSHAGAGDDELYLITFKWNVHSGSRTANSKWLSEITHDNPLLVNTQTARAMGIKEGDLIRISSSRGSLAIKAHLTHGIHPRVVAIGGGLGHWQYGGVAQAQKFKSNDPDTKLVWWEKHGHGVCPNSLIPVALDPVGGSQAWMDTRVRIARI